MSGFRIPGGWKVAGGSFPIPHLGQPFDEGRFDLPLLWPVSPLGTFVSFGHQAWRRVASPSKSHVSDAGKWNPSRELWCADFVWIPFRRPNQEPLNPSISVWLTEAVNLVNAEPRISPSWEYRPA